MQAVQSFSTLITPAVLVTEPTGETKTPTVEAVLLEITGNDMLCQRQINGFVKHLLEITRDGLSETEALWLIARVMGYQNLQAFRQAFNGKRYRNKARLNGVAIVQELSTTVLNKPTTPLNHHQYNGVFIRRCLREQWLDSKVMDVIRKTDLSQLQLCKTEEEIMTIVDRLPFISERFITKAVKRLREIQNAGSMGNRLYAVFAKRLGYHSWVTARGAMVKRVLINLNYVVKT